MEPTKISELCKCGKCGYVWYARIDDPQNCPRCKTYSGKTPIPSKEITEGWDIRTDKVHSDLVLECIWYLGKLGFSNIRREFEFDIPEYRKNIRVDILAESPEGVNTPIECGTLGEDFRVRIRILREKFDHFYWYPISEHLIKMTPIELGDFGLPVIEETICQKCGFKWKPRKMVPQQCPYCKSKNWSKK